MLNRNVSEPDFDAELKRAARIVAMFSLLVHACQTHHFEDAARNQRELIEMGVEVRFTRPRGPRKGVKHG